MYVDIVMPDGNEEEFVKVASALGYSGLCFFYPEKFSKKDYGFDVFYASAKSGDLKVSSAIGDFRRLIERGSVNVMFDFEKIARKDSLHQRNSGVNHVLASLMNKKNVALGFSLYSLLESESFRRCQIMGRMMQNIKLSLKYDVSLCFASFAKKPYQMRAVSDLIGLLTCFGLNAGEAKAALVGVSSIISENAKKKSSSYICEGVTLVEE